MSDYGDAFDDGCCEPVEVAVEAADYHHDVDSLLGEMEDCLPAAESSGFTGEASSDGWAEAVDGSTGEWVEELDQPAADHPAPAAVSTAAEVRLDGWTAPTSTSEPAGGDEFVVDTSGWTAEVTGTGPTGPVLRDPISGVDAVTIVAGPNLGATTELPLGLTAHQGPEGTVYEDGAGRRTTDVGHTYTDEHGVTHVRL